MKEVTIETTSTHIEYSAFDDTMFNSKEECQKYEESALGVIKKRIWKYKVEKEYNAWDFMGGYDDHEIVAFKVPDKEIANYIVQWVCLTHPYYLAHEDKFNEVYEKIYSAIGDVVLFGKNCDDEYYLINSRKNIITNLKYIYND